MTKKCYKIEMTRAGGLLLQLRIRSRHTSGSDVAQEVSVCML